MRLRFGLQLSSVWDASVPPAQQLREHEELTRTAEQLGFDFVSVGQHFLGADLRYYQPIPYLAHLAGVAPRLRVATGIVLLPLLHPVDVAEQMATLDVVSGGRAILGVGLGYSDRELQTFGVQRRARTGRFEEAIEVVRRVWRGDHDQGFSGRHFSFASLSTAARPVQQPGPPLWIGGQSAPAVRRAARLGDAWWVAPFPTHDEVRTLRAIYDEECNALGRPVPETLPLRRDVVLAPTRAEAERLAEQWTSRRFRTYMDWGLGTMLPAGTRLDSHVDEVVRSRFLLGPPDDVAEQIEQLRADVRMSHLVLKPQWQGLEHRHSLEQLERFGSEVIPRLPSAREN
jgi:alkanesulfonate monooxygenase SsuD/methylene tetrahydromethanopterin reductase-like flavin-dependent oxidoreductase (luciferase family)